MKKIFLLVLLLSCFTIISGQNLRIKNLDFSEGDWEMYINIGEGTESELKNLSNRYTDDEKEIESIISKLIISKDTISTGFSHYTQDIILVKNGIFIDDIMLLNSMGKACFGSDYFNYDPKAFFEKTKKLKKVDNCLVTIPNRLDAIKLRTYLTNRKGIYFYRGDSAWSKFEAVLSFEIEQPNVVYKKPVPDTILFSNSYRLKQSIKNQIAEGKQFIDLPDSLLQAPAKLSNEELSKRAAKRELWRESIYAKIEKELKIGKMDYQIQIYCSGSKMDNYRFYSTKENCHKFKSYQILKEWEIVRDIPFNIYGMSFKQLLKVMEKF